MRKDPKSVLDATKNIAIVFAVLLRVLSSVGDSNLFSRLKLGLRALRALNVQRWPPSV